LQVSGRMSKTLFCPETNSEQSPLTNSEQSPLTNSEQSPLTNSEQSFLTCDNVFAVNGLP